MQHSKISNFSQLVTHLAERGQRRRIAVVNGTDASTQAAVARAIECGFAEIIFVGARQEIENNKLLSVHRGQYEIIDAADPDDAAAKAVELVRQGCADVLMKGMINTDNLLRAVLNKTNGILPQGHVLTHVTAAEIPAYNKLLLFSDVAVIPYPTPEQRTAQIRYVADTAHRLGIERPRISLIHCSEKVDERHFPFTADYVDKCRQAADGEFGDVIVDGPLDVLTSVSREALHKKHIDSPIQGEADALIFPDIEAGNAFYKTITVFGGATVSGMLCGPEAPVVLASRGDSPDSKFYSLALTCL